MFSTQFIKSYIILGEKLDFLEANVPSYNSLNSTTNNKSQITNNCNFFLSKQR